MIITIVSTAALVTAAFFAIVATRPGHFHIARSVTIAAPPEVVFEHVNDVRKFQEWSPWAKRDPQATTTFEGPSAGVGAVFKWAGNNQVGEGIMTVVDSRPGELVRFRLEFLKPMKATNTAEFTFEPQGDQTKVTWSMSGESKFMCKAMGLFMDMDKMIGGDFEKGLASLRSIAESQTQVAFASR